MLLNNGRLAPPVVALWACCASCLLIASYVAVRYANQLPLDILSFRQTQTALTAFWLQRNGFGLSYETPVAGPPWALPFEFPIYQWIVASIATWFDADLDTTARLVSFAFLVSCTVPVHRLCKQLQLSPNVFPIFCALLFSSPTYVYWSRTFMVETTAVFLTVVAIRYFVDLLDHVHVARSASLFTLFASLAILQKTTTAFPMIVVLGVIFVASRLWAARVAGQRVKGNELLVATICFGIPMLIGFVWTLHADQVKLHNPLGIQLTSDALSSWNWGTVEQRFSSALYRHVVLDRIFINNAGGYFGLLVLIAALIFAPLNRFAGTLYAAIVLGFLPVLLFSNLHLIHDYYACANLIFVLFALAIALGEVLAARTRRKWLVVLATLLVVSSNYQVFFTTYYPVVITRYTAVNSKELAVASMIEAEVPADKAFVAFDFDWSSSLAYLSHRRSFTVPVFFNDYAAALEDPTRLMGRESLGAVVACPRNSERRPSPVVWAEREPHWKIGVQGNCYLAAPERPYPRLSDPVDDAGCQVTALSSAPSAIDARYTDVRVQLPLAQGRPDRRTSYYVARVEAGKATDFHEMLDVSRIASDGELVSGVVGFSRLMPAATYLDDKRWRVVRAQPGRLSECAIPDAAPVSAG